MSTDGQGDSVAETATEVEMENPLESKNGEILLEDHFVDAEEEEVDEEVEEEEVCEKCHGAHIQVDSKLEEEATSKAGVLETRLLTLRQTIREMKDQLKEELEGWRRTEARALPSSSCSGSVVSVDKEPRLNELELEDCEARLGKYQEALEMAQREQQIRLKRQLAMSAFKQRLLEVENMCNLELLRVKQNVQFLQPLQTMVSEWNMYGDNSLEMASHSKLQNKLSAEGDFSMLFPKPDVCSDMQSFYLLAGNNPPVKASASEETSCLDGGEMPVVNPIM